MGQHDAAKYAAKKVKAVADLVARLTQWRINCSSKCNSCSGLRAFGGPAILRVKPFSTDFLTHFLPNVKWEGTDFKWGAGHH